MRAGESFAFGPISATTAAFMLTGGQYMALACCESGWNGGSAVLNILGPDGVTWLSAINTLTADGGGVLDVPPGQYQWALTGLVNAYVSLTRIPVSE